LVRRHEVDLFRFQGTDESFLDVGALTARVHGLPLDLSRGGMVGKGLFLSRLRGASRAMARAIDAGGYDIAFVHHCAFTQAPLVLSSLRTPSVYFCQEPLRRAYEHPEANGSPERRRAGWARRMADGLIARLDAQATRAATVVLANSLYSRESILRCYGVSARLNYLGVDAGDFPFAPSEPREDFVLSVGRLAPHKGHAFVIQGLAAAAQAERPELVIAYDSEEPGERARLEALSRRLSVRLRLLRHPPERMTELYRTARLVLYAPHLEPLGLVALEAMSSGTPVVGVHEAGVRETVRHGETGLLTERDAAAFGAAVAGLLADRSARERMGRAGRRAVEERWSWDASTATLEGHMLAVRGLAAP
ncbi:MAG: glycosyltransferase family 4 protein, partial [Elusimicrobia bacterium]|nr:glycosyltransferase family 4 protein [Elusimicrobiota bacterium]